MVIDSNTLMTIKDKDHPHFTESGWLFPDSQLDTTGQHYMKLSNCEHGKVGCYVLESEVEAVPAEVAKDNSTNSTELILPYKYKPFVVKKLVEAFEKSYSVTEACQYAGIDRGTYYNWIEQVDGFDEIIEEAKSRPLKLAKDVIRDALIANDVSTAKWYAERRDPDFKPKAEVDNTHELKETRRKLGDILNERKPDDFGKQPSTAAEPDGGGDVPASPTDIS